MSKINLTLQPLLLLTEYHEVPYLHVTAARYDPDWPRFKEGRAQVDNVAYLEGWRDALAELWKAVSPALR